MIASGKHVYVAGWPDADLRASLMKWAAKAAGLATIDLPEAVRLRKRGDLTFAFNYGDVSWTPPVSRGFLLGGPNVDPQDVAVEDLNSLNGTWVNGVRIHPGQRRPLKPGDVLQIGTVQMKLVLA